MEADAVQEVIEKTTVQLESLQLRSDIIKELGAKAIAADTKIQITHTVVKGVVVVSFLGSLVYLVKYSQERTNKNRG